MPRSWVTRYCDQHFESKKIAQGREPLGDRYCNQHLESKTIIAYQYFESKGDMDP